MKTLKKGKLKPPPAPWWVGEILVCGSCDTKIELEEGDPVKETTERRMNGKADLTIPECPTCNQPITKTFHNRPYPKKTF